MEYAGLMAIEVGKTRLEALGEVEEAADLIRYYAKTAEDNAFYDHPMDNLGDAAVHTRSILRPHGVFAVISPFNFPMALAVGPSCAAMMAGNTVVFKPASASAMTAIAIARGVPRRGRPGRRVQPRDGPGRHGRRRAPARTRASTASCSPARTRSGFELFRNFSTRFPRPCIVEMGGKNPAIVLRSRGPRGGGRGDHALRVRLRRPEVLGQQPGLRRAAGPRRARPAAGREDREARRSATRCRGPRSSARSSTQRAVDRHQQAVAEARRDGTVFTGGEHLTDGDLARGFYVEPTVVGGLPATHRLFQDELFAPFTAVHAVDSLDEALAPRQRQRLRPDRRRVLEDPAEVQRFLDEIEAGVLYVNRRAGATTGAWPGVQAFGGWKGSGLDRQGRPVDVLRRAVPAGAEPHRRRLRSRAPSRDRGESTRCADRAASR